VEGASVGGLVSDPPILVHVPSPRCLSIACVYMNLSIFLECHRMQSLMTMHRFTSILAGMMLLPLLPLLLQLLATGAKGYGYRPHATFTRENAVIFRPTRGLRADSVNTMAIAAPPVPEDDAQQVTPRPLPIPFPTPLSDVQDLEVRRDIARDNLDEAIEALKEAYATLGRAVLRRARARERLQGAKTVGAPLKDQLRLYRDLEIALIEVTTGYQDVTEVYGGRLEDAHSQVHAADNELINYFLART
jgi:hypothetical protein